MVKHIPQEPGSERMCEQSESPDHLWQLDLDACVGHDPAARALVCKRLREWCLMNGAGSLLSH